MTVKPKRVVCSICSRAKALIERPIPARQRYQGSHIALVEKEARKSHQSFFILSGVYGLVAANEEVPYYDHLLSPEEVPVLAEKMTQQIRMWSIDEIHFFTKTKPRWMPYTTALQAAAQAAGATVVLHPLADSA